jgi:hypothetical protein
MHAFPRALLDELGALLLLLVLVCLGVHRCLVVDASVELSVGQVRAGVVANQCLSGNEARRRELEGALNEWFVRWLLLIWQSHAA